MASCSDFSVHSCPLNVKAGTRRWSSGPSSRASFGIAKSSSSRNSLKLEVQSQWRISRARAISQQVAASENASQERERLKGILRDQIGAASGNLDAACMETIKELEKLNPNPKSLDSPALSAGYWERLKAAHVGTGKKGEGKVDVGYDGAKATLGRVAFNLFKPADLEIVMGEVYTYVPDFTTDDQRKYCIFIEFTTHNPGGEDLPPIEGVISNWATAKVLGPSRLEIRFDETTLRPSYPERDLAAWKAIFQEANGTLSEDGELSAKMEKAPGGFMEITYTDDNMRISYGHLGSYVVASRMDQPPSLSDDGVLVAVLTKDDHLSLVNQSFLLLTSYGDHVSLKPT